MDMYKQLVKEGFTSSSLYGKTLKPIQIENKKESKKYNFWVGKKHRFPDSSFKKSPHTSSKKS